MHIYLWQINPPLQSSIDALNTTTQNLADLYIYNNAYIPMADWPPSQSSIDSFNTATPNLAHLMAEQCTYTSGRCTPSVNQAWMPWIPLQQTWQIYIYKCSESDITPLFRWGEQLRPKPKMSPYLHIKFSDSDIPSHFSDKVNNWDQNQKRVHIFMFYCHFQLLSLCNWPSLWVHLVYKIQSLLGLLYVIWKDLLWSKA